MTDLTDDILAAAGILAKRLNKAEEVTTADLLDGLKVLTPYYTALTRKKPAEDDGQGPGTFADMKQRIHGTREQ